MKNTPIKLIDCSFNFLPEFSGPVPVIEQHAAGYGYALFIKERLALIVIEHINYEGEKMMGGVKYRFFKRKSRFVHIPFKTLRYIQQQQPDIVIAQGLIFPLQVIALRLKMGRKCPIIVQHHGEKPFTGIKRRLQQIADKCITAYLFTARGNARAWIDNHIIPGYDKCYELLEASTYFERCDKVAARKKTGITGDHNFLWVGRLNANKDPMTVVQGFEKYLAINPQAKLYMIYQEEALLPALKIIIGNSGTLKDAVYLRGKVPHGELPDWYSAADFYISGSREEGSGYALLEAMACGCIPVVTDIPSFRKMTAGGKFGFLYEAGNPLQLLKLLISLETIDRKKLSDAIANHFSNELSFKAIADKLFVIINQQLMANGQQPTANR